MNAKIKMVGGALLTFLVFRALETTLANFGMDWTAILPRPSASASAVPTAAGDA